MSVLETIKDLLENFIKAIELLGRHPEFYTVIMVSMSFIIFICTFCITMKLGRSLLRGIERDKYNRETIRILSENNIILRKVLSYLKEILKQK